MRTIKVLECGDIFTESDELEVFAETSLEDPDKYILYYVPNGTMRMHVVEGTYTLPQIEDSWEELALKDIERK